MKDTCHAICQELQLITSFFHRYEMCFTMEPYVSLTNEGLCIYFKLNI
jgi:hypothetical protein